MGSTEEDINKLLELDRNVEASRFDVEVPQREVFMSAYLIDKSPVTNADYKKFIESGGYKQRDRKTGKVNILSGKVEVKNRDLIIVDDMISTGGSIIKATQFLKKQKCKRVFVACTHALLVNDAAKKIKSAGVTQIISTNTIPGDSAKVDVSKVISDALK